jgi:hypothetical protein
MFPSVPPKRKDDNKIADKPGLDFPAFPYKPYDIQSQFMQILYKVLEDGGVGLMESPTGTRVHGGSFGFRVAQVDGPTNCASFVIGVYVFQGRERRLASYAVPFSG